MTPIGSMATATPGEFYLAEIFRLTAQVAELEKDAGRYRFCLAFGFPTHTKSIFTNVENHWRMEYNYMSYTGDTAEEAINAAMEGK